MGSYYFALRLGDWEWRGADPWKTAKPLKRYQLNVFPSYFLMLQCLRKQLSVIVLPGRDPAKPLDSWEFWWLAFEWSSLTSKLNVLYSCKLTCVVSFFPFLWGERELVVHDTELYQASQQMKFPPDHLGNLLPSNFRPSLGEIFYILALDRWN